MQDKQEVSRCAIVKNSIEVHGEYIFVKCIFLKRSKKIPQLDDEDRSII